MLTIGFFNILTHVETDPKQESEEAKTLKADLIAFAYELGIWIVAPLLVFLSLGIFVDKRFDTKPIGLIAALLLSLLSTGVSIAKKIKKFNP